MKREQNSFLWEVSEIFLQMLQSFKGSIKAFLSGEKSTSTTINTSIATKSDKTLGTKSIVVSTDDLLRELHRKASELHYLLDATTALLVGKFTRENAKILVEKWDYMLAATCCDSLNKKFSAIKKSAHTDEETIRTWLNFFAELGLSQVFTREEKIILSPENRKFFENGRLYQDGKHFFINKYPWSLNGELLIRGELYGEDEL